MTIMVRIVASLGLLLFAGCARRSLVTERGAVTTGEIVSSVELGKEENIARALLAEGSDSSVFLVRIRHSEEPHAHTRYDLSIVVVEGKGTLWLGARAVPMRAGDVAFIPRGMPHYFVNHGRDPAAALAIFSPRFDEPDSQPVSMRPGMGVEFPAKH
jgi:quercetin dioxygenase-like cupin family protein